MIVFLSDYSCEVFSRFSMTDEICITLDDVKEAAERTRDEVHRTPLLHSDNISGIAGVQTYFKMECLQRCKAFKFRGALNKLRTLPSGTTVCCCSAGNHSQGVALSATLCGCRSVIFMPETAPSAKVQATQHYGGEVIQTGANFDEAKAACMQALSEHTDWIFVPPYNDKHVIAGTGTIGLEILEQLPDVDTIVVPIGGGGLISGLAYTVKTLKPSVRVIGVQMASCPYAYKMFHGHRNSEVPAVNVREAVTPLSDGIQVKSPGELNLAIIWRYVDDVVIVTEDEVAVAVALLAERGKVVSEGAGATPLAAILAKKFAFRPDEKVVGVVSGGNIQLTMLARCIDRALFLRRSRVGLSVTLPYGTQHLTALLGIFAGQHVEVVACVPLPHVDTIANRERYSVVIDISTQECLKRIEHEFDARQWPYAISSTAASDD
jgi:threonine dehydratase